MVFSSISFLFFFLPVFLLVFHLLRFAPKLRFSFLLLSSLFFYFWGENYLVWILLASTTIDFICGLIISGEFSRIKPTNPGNTSKRPLYQKFGLTVSIFSNLAFLGYFKYANFFMDNFIAFCWKTGLHVFIPEQIVTIILPLGISFYTFQSMSYTIDVYRGKVHATKSYIKFAAYVTMFPQLVAGPIVRYSHIQKQMASHSVSADDIVVGIKRFVTGLAKKVIIANTLATVPDAIYSMPQSELSTGLAWLGIISYSLQLYFDFSGYSDMAIGLGRMIGFRFPENFNYPYISRSIREFWQRWHITLSTWFRDYLYISLGGSRKGSFNTYRNLLIVFITCGLWHGASWNYALWGLSHGFFMVLEKIPFLQKLGRVPKIFQHLYMLFVFNVTLVIFRVDGIPEAFNYVGILLGFGGAAAPWPAYRELLHNHVIIALLAGILFSMPVFGIVKGKIMSLSVELINLARFAYLILMVLLFVLSAISLASGTYNPFIYFRF
jgi:alginate O-acetyltransferase complex protein AlgI